MRQEVPNSPKVWVVIEQLGGPERRAVFAPPGAVVLQAVWRELGTRYEIGLRALSRDYEHGQLLRQSAPLSRPPTLGHRVQPMLARAFRAGGGGQQAPWEWSVLVTRLDQQHGRPLWVGRGD